MIMLLIQLAVFSLIVWIIVTYIAKSEPIRTIILAVAAIFAIIFLLSAFGIMDVPVPRVR